MRTLLDEQYAPITSRIGFINLPIDDATEVFVGWRRGLYGDVTVTDVGGDGFPLALHRLEPLELPSSPRELLVEMGAWTAYFDCGLHGTDPIGPVSVMCQFARCRGMAIRVIPDTGLRLGAVSWELFADHPTSFLNYERSITLVNQGTRWVFETYGMPLPFEDLERYKRRRARDRFDSAMAEAYSRAVGVDAFDRDAYGPRAILVTHTDGAPPLMRMALADVQARFGIQPGRAEHLPG